MRAELVAVLCLGLAAVTGACSDAAESPTPGPDASSAIDASAPPIEPEPTDGDYVWRIPPGFPKPKVPIENPMSQAKVELGRHLFYDTRLSENRTTSCESCHHQELAFTDGLAQSVGSTGEVHPRSAQSLVNVGYASALTWQNDLLTTLEIQGRVPLFGDDPVELGMRGREELLLTRLQDVPRYTDLFTRAFPDDEAPISVKNVLYALSAFQRTLISGDSAYDRFLQGDRDAIDDAAKRGRELFFSERMECFHCHGGFGFADAVSHEGTAFVEKPFHNNALYNIDGKGGYPLPSRGLIDVSARAEDMGRFKAPTLRNIEVTAPYMHDGSIQTLEEVVEHYARGGRRVDEGPGKGDGASSPLKSEFVRGFIATEQEKADLVAFLRSLTDHGFLRDARHANPWSTP